MKKKCDLCVFDHGMDVGARRSDVSISETPETLYIIV